ncbi:hypothetical protein Moror_4669 [Moniliophthora roreri MCA 2997]|uniref:Protein-S-isoprenylcysteine O-methyltransferase n=1 Tax=Moniliophthora roreri (strain MCA 2997) TaxID=1381753 RepID=V2XHG3_MONRO|nr:hypothetical protein Moror_4669 [Moniliophthora roreri MCA 2997]
MSLIKLPFLLLSTISLHVGMTPPNRPPPVKEQYIPNEGVAHTGEVVLRRILTAGGPVTYFKMLFWTACFLETALILSLAYRPTSPITSSLLVSRTLVSGDLVSRVTEIKPVYIITSLLVALGGIIRVHCFRALGASFTFELSVQKDHKLVTSGLYSVVRHPSYTGAVISLSFGVFQHLIPGSWVRESGILGTFWGRMVVMGWFGGMTLMVATLMMRITSEEEILAREFGDKWAKWRQDVPYKLFPGVY